MHRFLKSSLVHGTQLALRSDASIWLLARDEIGFSVDRGDGWIRARKIRLCLDDRVRMGESRVTMADLCRELGIDYQQVCESTRERNSQSGDASLQPVFVPTSVIDDARRNPETGQIEPSTKDSS